MSDNASFIAGNPGKLQNLVEAIELRLNSVNRPLISTISIICFLLLWEVAGRGINPIFASYPSAIMVASVEMLREGVLVHAFVQSMQPLVSASSCRRCSACRSASCSAAARSPRPRSAST